jgi:hypothetical protein
MNKLILFIALVIFPSWSLLWAASYQLQLKNGSEIKTSHYWEEGNEIKFYQYGGVVGVPRANVIGIKSSNANLQENKDTIPTDTIVKDQKVGDNTKTHTDKKEEKLSKDTEKIGTIDPNYYREQKAALKDKLDDALEKNREATRRKDQDGKAATRQEMLKYSQQLHDLERELKEKNKGTLPDWWKE